jgi:hypothetical protein
VTGRIEIDPRFMAQRLISVLVETWTFSTQAAHRQNIVVLLVHLRRGGGLRLIAAMQGSGMSVEWPFCDIRTQFTVNRYRTTQRPRTAVKLSMRVSISFADLRSIFRELRAKRRFTANH